MWVSGITQGLMWRAYDKLGFLQYSFIETVEAMKPYYIIRAIGGLLFVIGALIMAYNVWRTIRGDEPVDVADQPRVAAAPGLRTAAGGMRGEAMKHEVFEKNSILLLIGILVVVSIGGLVQIAPLFWVESTIEKVKGMRPYTPLEQAGRDIYVREGCYGCHSQMIRTLRDEVERYGHYSLAAESMYDHPFQWGSKRTGPDLARVGGKYSDQWQAEHLINPRARRAGEHHAGLSLARRAQARRCRHRRARMQDAEDWSACPTRDEMIDEGQGRSRRAGRRPTAGRRASC